MTERKREQLAYGDSIPSSNRILRQLLRRKKDREIAEVLSEIDSTLRRDHLAAKRWR